VTNNVEGSPASWLQMLEIIGKRVKARNGDGDLFLRTNVVRPSDSQVH
jgi:hypothetical protein